MNDLKISSDLVVFVIMVAFASFIIYATVKSKLAAKADKKDSTNSKNKI